MITLDQFVTANTNVPVDVDHEYGAQCWDLVELYAEQVLGLHQNPWAITLNGSAIYPAGDAKNAWLCFSDNPQLQENFDQIPVGQEQRGDILVYNGHGVYTEGHIAICLGNGQVFEQNADPDGSNAHVYSRANTYLLGALRLMKGIDMINNQADADLVFAATLHTIDESASKSIIGLEFDKALQNIEGTPEWKAQDSVLNVYMPQVLSQLGITDPSTAAAAIKKLQGGPQQLAKGLYQVS